MEITKRMIRKSEGVGERGNGGEERERGKHVQTLL